MDDHLGDTVLQGVVGSVLSLKDEPAHRLDSGTEADGGDFSIIHRGRDDVSAGHGVLVAGEFQHLGVGGGGGFGDDVVHMRGAGEGGCYTRAVLICQEAQ